MRSSCFAILASWQHCFCDYCAKSYCGALLELAPDSSIVGGHEVGAGTPRMNDFATFSLLSDFSDVNLVSFLPFCSAETLHRLPHLMAHSLCFLFIETC